MTARREFVLYTQQQPEAVRSFHRLMKMLETAGLALPAAALLLTLYFSFSWKTIPDGWIAAAWFLFAASAAPTIILLGIHISIVKAHPPDGPAAGLFTGKNGRFVAGRDAMLAGWGYIAGGLALAAFWGLFAHAALTLNWAILTPMITVMGTAMGVMIVISMFFAAVQQLTKAR